MKTTILRWFTVGLLLALLFLAQTPIATAQTCATVLQPCMYNGMQCCTGFCYSSPCSLPVCADFGCVEFEHTCYSNGECCAGQCTGGVCYA